MPGYLPASICFFSSSPFGPPAMSTSVGSQSSAANSWFLTVPGLMCARPANDHRSAIAAFPGLALLALERRDAAVGEGDRLGAVVGGEDDDGVVELAHVLELLEDVADVVVHLLHAGFVDAPVLAAAARPPWPSYLADSTVVTCMRAGLYQTKNGLLVFFGSLRSRKSMTLAEISSSTVFDRSSVSGPSSLQVWFFSVPSEDLQQRTGRGGVRQIVVFGIDGARDLGDARDRRVPARRRDALHGRGLVDVGEAHLLHGVEVIEIAPVLLEAVRGRQRLGVVAEVVLAELAGVVAEVEQELGERRRSRPQIGRAAGQLRRDHAGAQRIHAGEEGVAARRAALHGDVVHEDRAFVGRCGRCWASRRPSGRDDRCSAASSRCRRP